MLGIILSILKIILWIILAILGLLFVLVLLVLFSPIRYKVDLDYHEQAHLKAKIHFLIVCVTIVFDQATGKLDQVIRIAGFRLRKREETLKSGDVEQQEDDSLIDTPDEGGQTESESDGISDGKIEADDFEFVDPMYDLWDEGLQEPLPPKEKKFLGRLKVLINKIVSIIKKLSPLNIICTIQSKIEKVQKFKLRIKKFFNLSCTIKTRVYLKKYIVSVFKHILPRKIRGYVRYGFDEPYKTGQITGYLSLMPFVYQKHLSLQPDFYNKVLEARLQMKGKIRIGYLVRIVLNVNIWRTLKALKRLMNKTEHNRSE
ncbi:MAG: DUF2953 domain-containing protein [Lachnospiraceae bacterium]|nr:DUF2953 domain-containing protein [Lachnospiraceae bacterium]